MRCSACRGPLARFRRMRAVRFCPVCAPRVMPHAFRRWSRYLRAFEVVHVQRLPYPQSAEAIGRAFC